MKMIRALLGLLLLVSVGPAAAESLNLGPHGDLTLDLPSGWTLNRQGADTPGGPALRIEPPGGIELVLLVTPMPVKAGLDGKDVARQIAEQVVEHFKPTAVESSLPIQPIDGPVAHGYFVSMTDKTVSKPTTTDFKHGDQGAVSLGPVLLSFTLLSNAPERPERAQALAIVRNAGLTPPGTPAAGPARSAKLPASGRPWSLLLDLPGFEIQPNQFRDDGSGSKLTATRASNGMMVTAFIETAQPGKSAVDYRESSWKTLQAPGTPEEQDVARSERGATAILEYMLNESRGVKIEQKHMNAYLVRDGRWIDVHISKVHYKPADAELFDKIVASIRFTEPVPAKH